MIDRRKAAENLVASASTAIILMTPRDESLPMWLSILDGALKVCIETKSSAFLDMRAAAASLLRAESREDEVIALEALRSAVRLRSLRLAADLNESLVRGY
jgi:hypothetical protein